MRGINPNAMQLQFILFDNLTVKQSLLNNNNNNNNNNRFYCAYVQKVL